jgi:tetratricopeptide (TPR) repeat protein
MVWAQQPAMPSLGPAPQARTSQEFDDWLDLVDSANPASTVRQAADFLARYPRSEFAARVYQAQMLAYQQMENYEGTVAAGKKALALDPSNLHVLATLANVIPNPGGGRRPDDEQLEAAAKYARQALGQLTVQKIPRSLDLREWQRIKLKIEVSARAALGLISLLRGQTTDAIRELQWVPESDIARNQRVADSERRW